MGLRKIEVDSKLPIEELVKEIIRCPEERIILEISDDSQLLTNEINLRLLKFYAEEESKELIINTVDPVIASMVYRVGLATLNNSSVVTPFDREIPELPDSEAEVAAVPEVKPRGISRRSNTRQGGLLMAIAIAFFTLVIAVWWFLQPKAVIIVYPKEQNLDFAADAQISPGFSETIPEEGKVPAKFLEKMATITIPVVTTGSKIIGVTPSIGRITLVNSTNQTVVVPKKSILLGKSDVRFLTDEDVMVPKKTTKYQNGIPLGENYGKAEVGFTAENKGTLGNQPAKAINRINGPLQRFIQVINLLPTKNGTDKKVAVATLEDVKKGESEAKRQLQLVGPEEIANLITKDFLFIPELVRFDVIRITNSPEIGMEGEQLQTKLDYKASVLVTPVVEVSKLLTYKFEKSIPASFQPKNHKIELIATKIISADTQQATVNFTGRGRIVGILTADKIKQWVTGKTLNQAKEELTRQEEIADFKIDLPDNGSRLPGFGFQIKVLLPAGPK